MSYDGSQYKGVDEQAARNAGPLDTWMENRLRSNALNVLRGYQSVSWQPDAGGMSLDEVGSARPFASSEWTTILIAPWVIDVTLRKLFIDMLYLVGSAGGAGNFDARAELYNHRFELLGRSQQELAYSEGNATRKWQTQRFELDLAYHARTERMGWFVLWGRSQDGGEVAPGAVDQIGMFNQTIEPESSAIWPGLDSAEPRMLVSADGSDAPGQMFDVLRPTSRGGYGVPVQVALNLAGVTASYTRHYLTKLFVRSVCVQPSHDGDELLPPRSAFRANIAVDGASSTSLGRSARLAYAQARPLLLGPNPGITDLEDPEYRSRWRLVTAANAGAPQRVWESSVRIDAENPHVDVVLFYVGIHSRNDAWIYDEEDGRELDRDALADWTFSAELDQLENGQTWNSASSRGAVEVSRRVSHMPDDPLGTFPLLYKAWLSLPGGRTEDYSELTSEGQLYAQDLPLLRTVLLRIPVSGLDTPARTHRACRLRVFARYDGGAYFPGGGNPNLNRATTDFLHLLAVGGSVWQRGIA